METFVVKCTNLCTKQYFKNNSQSAIFDNNDIHIKDGTIDIKEIRFQ